MEYTADHIFAFLWIYGILAGGLFYIYLFQAAQSNIYFPSSGTYVLYYLSSQCILLHCRYLVSNSLQHLRGPSSSLIRQVPFYFNSFLLACIAFTFFPKMASFNSNSLTASNRTLLKDESANMGEIYGIKSNVVVYLLLNNVGAATKVGTLNLCRAAGEIVALQVDHQRKGPLFSWGHLYGWHVCLRQSIDGPIALLGPNSNQITGLRHSGDGRSHASVQ